MNKFKTFVMVMDAGTFCATAFDPTTKSRRPNSQMDLAQLSSTRKDPWPTTKWNKKARRIYRLTQQTSLWSWVKKLFQSLRSDTTSDRDPFHAVIFGSGLISVRPFSLLQNELRAINLTEEARQAHVSLIPPTTIRRSREHYEATVYEPQIIAMAGHGGDHSGAYGTSQDGEYYMIDDNPAVLPDLVMDINEKMCWRYFPENWARLILLEHPSVLFFTESTIPEIVRVLKPGGKLVMQRSSFMARVSNPYLRNDGLPGIFIGAFGRHAGVCDASSRYLYGVDADSGYKMRKLVESAAWHVMHKSFMASGLFTRIVEEVTPTWEGQKPVIVMTKR
jgi:hypothetical protein